MLQTVNFYFLLVGASRHWNFVQSHDDHEQLCERYFRTDCRRVIEVGPLQQALNNYKPRNSNCCPSSFTWRVGQTCCFRRYQGGYQVHEFKVKIDFQVGRWNSVFYKTYFFTTICFEHSCSNFHRDFWGWENQDCPDSKLCDL